MRIFKDNVRRLFVKPTDTVGRMVHAALGASSETGEIASAIKAHWIYGRELDTENVIEEIGDTLFYLSALCDEMGVTLETCMLANIDKLNKRYPDGYSDMAANERADKQ